jgi:tetratricopeptide (TPR) repeat protein
VSYNSLLGDRRRALHDRAANGIEDLYGSQLEDHYSHLAHHCLRGNDAGKATLYAQLAAEQALSRAAYPQAMSLVEAGLKLVDKLPTPSERGRTELGLRTIESTVAAVLWGHSSSQRERAIKRMCELAENIGTADEFLRALSTLSGLYFTQGESARGLELATRCLTLARASQNQGLLLDALSNAGILSWSCGNLREAASHFDDALREVRRTSSLASLQSQNGILYTSNLRGQIALNLQHLGRVSNAAQVGSELLSYARKTGHLFTVGYALVIGSLLTRDEAVTGAMAAIRKRLFPDPA